MEMNKRVVELLRIRKNGCQLTLDEYEELLSLINWHLIQSMTDRKFVIAVLRAYF